MYGPCCNQMQLTAEARNLQAKAFSKNSNFSYYNIILYYGDSSSNYAGVNYCNILYLVDCWIVAEGEFVDIIDYHYKYFICHKNFEGHYYLLPWLCWSSYWSHDGCYFVSQFSFRREGPLSQSYFNSNF